MSSLESNHLKYAPRKQGHILSNWTSVDAFLEEISKSYMCIILFQTSRTIRGRATATTNGCWGSFWIRQGGIQMTSTTLKVLEHFPFVSTFGTDLGLRNEIHATHILWLRFSQRNAHFNLM